MTHKELDMDSLVFIDYELQKGGKLSTEKVVVKRKQQGEKVEASSFLDLISPISSRTREVTHVFQQHILVDPSLELDDKTEDGSFVFDNEDEDYYPEVSVGNLDSVSHSVFENGEDDNDNDKGGVEKFIADSTAKLRNLIDDLDVEEKIGEQNISKLSVSNFSLSQSSDIESLVAKLKSVISKVGLDENSRTVFSKTEFSSESFLSKKSNWMN